MHTVQHADEKLEFTNEFAATYTLKNGAHYITYTDSEPTTIIIKNDTVKIVKTQSLSSLTFEQGREYVSSYSTPAGRMSVSVITQKLLNEFNSKNEIFIKYELVFNEQIKTTNQISIKIEER